jgi:hypothetical protein
LTFEKENIRILWTDALNISRVTQISQSLRVAKHFLTKKKKMKLQEKRKKTIKITNLR